MPLGECDVCLKRNVPLRQAWVTGIETWACSECHGDEPGAYDEDEESDD